MAIKREFVSASEAQPPFFVGVDVGGTNTKIGLVDDRGDPLSYVQIKTRPAQGPEDGAARIGQAVREVIERAQLDADDVHRVGLAAPGTMDIPAGKFLEPHNLPGWFHFPIRDRVSAHSSKPVTFANDAGAAAYGEFWCGSGKEFQSLVLLTLGTGVGAGIILDGRSIDGAHGHGAECGHLIIDCNDNARRCGCGQTGHLEAYASATAVVQRTREAMQQGGSSSLQQHLDAGSRLTARLVAQEATAGDALSREIVMDTARFLGVGIVSILHTVDPQAVAIGGAMTFGGSQNELGRAFLERVRDEVRQRAFPVVAENVIIDFATLGSDAGFIGAAGLARADAAR